MFKNKRYWIVFMIINLLWVILYASGQFLDKQAEQQILARYSRNSEGIIQGIKERTLIRGHKTAIIIIHSFLSSPREFGDLFSRLERENRVDVYMPLLPFHGRDLETAAKLNNPDIIRFVQEYIKLQAIKYEKLILMGYSYGGAILVDLERRQKIPENSRLLLYAPAIFLKTNDWVGNLKLWVYHLWRNYCNYQALGCDTPAYESGDERARYHLEQEKALEYKIMSAVKEVYALDTENRNYFLKMQIPHDLFIAKDDNRVDFESQKLACLNNHRYCRLHAFPSGKHLLHWSTHEKVFENRILELIQAP